MPARKTGKYMIEIDNEGRQFIYRRIADGASIAVPVANPRLFSDMQLSLGVLPDKEVDRVADVIYELKLGEPEGAAA